MNRLRPVVSSSELTARRNAQMIYANKLIKEEDFTSGTLKNLRSITTNQDSSDYITTKVGAILTNYSIPNEDTLIIIENEDPIETPGTPTNVVGVAGVRQVALSWSASSYKNFPITSYRVTANAADASGNPITVTSTGTTVTVTGLANNTGYTFTVVAYNLVSESVPSVPSATITTFALPGAPTITGVTKPSSGQVNVAFTAGTTGGSPITGYTVTPYIGVTAQTVFTTTTTTSPILVTGLTPTTTYTFTLIATTAVGNSVASAASSTVAA